MAFLVRKIARAKWPEEKCELSFLDGDAISDLRTTDNTLSLWYIDSEEELETAALALSASSKSEKIDSFTVVWVPLEEIQAKGLSVVKSDGDTVVADLVKMHRDLNEITYGKLGSTAEVIMDALITEKHYKRFTRAQIKSALIEAYKTNRICVEKCNPKFLSEIEKA